MRGILYIPYDGVRLVGSWLKVAAQTNSAFSQWPFESQSDIKIYALSVKGWLTCSDHRVFQHNLNFWISNDQSLKFYSFESFFQIKLKRSSMLMLQIFEQIAFPINISGFSKRDFSRKFRWNRKSKLLRVRIFIEMGKKVLNGKIVEFLFHSSDHKTYWEINLVP